MNKGPSITLDLMLILLVLWVVLRGQGRSWIDTLFRYHPVNLDLNPMPDLGAALSNLNPLKGAGDAANNLATGAGNLASGAGSAASGALGAAGSAIQGGAAAAGSAIGIQNPQGGPSQFNPDTGQVQIQDASGNWIDVPGAGGNPQIAPGVG